MAYLNSSLIKVYPTGYRGKNVSERASYVNSEKNLNDIAGRLTSRDSYISKEDGINIEFVVGGYLFKATKSDITSLFENPSDGAIIYAVITVQDVDVVESGFTTKYETLVPHGSMGPAILDNANDKFTGVEFVSTLGQNESGLPLYIYSTNSSDWLPVEKSLIRFSSHHVSNKNTDNSIAERLDTDELHVTNDAEIGGDLDVSGKTTLQDTDITGDISIQGDTTQSGHITLGHVNGGDVLTIDRGNIKCDENEGTQSTLNSSGLTVSGNNKTSEVTSEEISTENININKLNNVSVSDIFENNNTTVKTATKLSGFTNDWTTIDATQIHLPGTFDDVWGFYVDNNISSKLIEITIIVTSGSHHCFYTGVIRLNALYGRGPDDDDYGSIYLSSPGETSIYLTYGAYEMNSYVVLRTDTSSSSIIDGRLYTFKYRVVGNLS